MDPKQAEILQIGLTISASLSLFGSTFICCNFISFRSERTFSGLLLFLLSVSDFFVSVTNLLSWGHPQWENGEEMPLLHGPLCIIQGVGLQFFRQSAIFWTGSIAIHMYLAIVKKINEERLQKFIVFYASISYGIPLILSVSPFIENSYGPAGVPDQFYAPWCWIKPKYSLIRMLTFYLPMLLVWTSNITCYFLLKRTIDRDFSWTKDIANYRLNSYLLVFVIVEVPSLLNRLQNVLFPGQPIFWLFFLQNLCTPLQGFLNSFVYAFRPEVWKNWIKSFKPRLKGENDPLLRKVDLSHDPDDDTVTVIDLK